MSCAEKHAPDDPRLGEPLCPDCYDYTGAGLFNACAPDLWRRFTISLPQDPRPPAGLTNKALAAQLPFPYAKVAENVLRVVGFHAIIRLYGPAGPPPPRPPGPLSSCYRRHRSGRTHRPPRDPPLQAFPARTLAGAANSTPARSPPPGNPPIAGWPLTSPSTGRRPPNAPAPWTAASPLPTGSNRLAHPRPARRHVAERLRLGKLSELEHLRLTAWAHMLGFRGHFSTKEPALYLHHPEQPCARTVSPTSANKARATGSAARQQRQHTTPVLNTLGTSPDADTRCPRTFWPPPSSRMRRPHRPQEVVMPVLLDGARGRRGPGHLPQQAYELMASGVIASIRIEGHGAFRLTAREEDVSRLLAERTGRVCLTPSAPAPADEPARRRRPARTLPSSATAS